MKIVRDAVLFVLVAGLPATGLAQTVQAFVNQASVPVNRQFVLNVEISGAQQLDTDPIPPDLSEFATYLGSGTSTSMQIVNGRTSVSLTLQYRYLATTTGRFEIGPVTVRAGGRDLTTSPVPVEVTAAATTPSDARPPGTDGVVAPNDLFVTATANRERVYVNEPVVVEYRIFTRVDIDGYTIASQPSTTGFWVEELEVPRQGVEQVVRDGLQYASTVIRRVALFPTSAGTKTLGPLRLDTQVRIRRRSRGLFDDPFFGGGLFGSGMPVAVGSDPVVVEVLPLPPGQPDSFTGLSGRLDVAASIDRAVGETNEALTYRLEVSGTGNLRTLAEPRLALPQGLDVYPAEVEEHVEPTDDGVRVRKTFDYVVVPRKPGEVVIPAIELSYFDTEQEAYAVAASEPVRVTIRGAPVEGDAGASARSRVMVDPQREDIRFIRIGAPTFRPLDSSLTRSIGFWSVLLLPMLAVAGALGFQRHRDRIRGDVAYARRRRASRLAKTRLARAASLRSPDRYREFHAELGRALQGFLGDVLNVSEAGLVREDVRARLLSRGAASDVVDAYLACLDECDRRRFAPLEPDPTAMRDMLTRASRVMTTLHQSLR